jgi:choline kinase
MKAIIYAAGRATRLGPEFVSRPKILIELGGRSLLEWHAVRLKEAGVHEFNIVTGHQRESIAAVLPGLGSRYGMRIREIPNPDYTEGSVLSLNVSLPDLISENEPVLLMDGDVLYPAEMLRRLIKSPYRAVLLIDRNFSTDDDDPVLVPIRHGQPFDFVKHWQGKAEQIGESVGFFKVAPTIMGRLAEATHKRLVGSGRLDSYDDVLRELVQAGEFGHEDVTGVPWTEVDFPKDVEYARQTVLPALMAQDASLSTNMNSEKPD